MIAGERQVAPTLAGIRRDHVARYEWAAKQLQPGEVVLDVACGVGYGSNVLAVAGCRILGFDKDREAIGYAREHYAHERAVFGVEDLEDPDFASRVCLADVAVCFETLEHMKDPRALLVNLRKRCDRLLASVPNEDEFPYRGYRFHFRHYTATQLEDLLLECGWKVAAWWGQKDDQAEVEEGCRGRTLIASCVPCEPALRAKRAPHHVAILGLGPSLRQYVELTKRQGGRGHLFDEVWGINALGDVLACDRLFHMDDVRIQEIRAAAKPQSNIAMMLRWLKKHPGPIYTSRAHPDYPGLVEYPLGSVINWGRHAYFNSTAAYAVAYAGWLGVRKVTCFGMDFTYPNVQDAEKGRACVEFWLGLLSSRGVRIGMPKASSLMDACLTEADRLYGYDTLDVQLEAPEISGDLCSVRFAERKDPLPTAEEIEKRYDHGAHPSPLVETQELGADEQDVRALLEDLTSWRGMHQDQGRIGMAETCERHMRTVRQVLGDEKEK